MMEWIITSSLLILVVILLRRVLRGKMSLRLQYGLWALVLLRLLLPFSFFESGLSVMNLANSFKGVELIETAGELGDMEDIEFTPIKPAVPSTATDITPIAPPSLGSVSGYYPGDSDHMFPTQVMENVTVEEFQQLEKAIKVQDIHIPIWLIGAAIMAAYFLLTNLRFGGALRRSRRAKDIPGSIIPVYVSEIIPTPCLFGLFHPAVYITPDCEKDLGTLRHVLAHESTHYRHGDNIWAVLRCVALAMHWYNPLVWWAAVLSKRDGELACDEGAIRRLGEDERAPYGRTLIGMTCQRSDFSALAQTATTMTGSKKSIKERVMLIAKKPRMAVYTLVAVILIAAAAVGCTFSGADSGFTDKEARKEALPLAESVAFQNGLEINGDGEISRVEGHILEAGDGLRQQYVSVKYDLKDSPFHIVVDFAMMDEKGECYDEPFNASAYVSKAGTPIIEDISKVQHVNLWKIGYENPRLPLEYEDELLDYISKCEYGEYIRHTSEVPEGANSAGFAVYFQDGSIVIGLDAAESHHVVRPELEPWLEEVFYAREITMEQYEDSGIAISEELTMMPSPVLDYAAKLVREDVEYLERMYDCLIEEAEISSLSQIQTGTASNTHAINMYELSYRLRPDKPDNIILEGGMGLEDGWLINGSFGKKYIVMLHTNVGGYVPLATLTDFDMESYRSDVYIEQYTTPFTAACMEIYGDYMEKLRTSVTFADGLSDALPRHITDSVLHYVESGKRDYSNYESPYEVTFSETEVTALSMVTSGAADSYGTGYVMYRLDYRFLPTAPEKVVLAGGMHMEDGWLCEHRYLVCETYKSEFTYNMCFLRELTIQETYALPHYIEAYGDMYTAACMEVLRSTPSPIVTVRAGTETVEPYLRMKYSKIWSSEIGTWIMGDGMPLSYSIEQMRDLIPEIKYAHGLSLEALNGYVNSPTLYTTDIKALDYEENATIEPGEYYLVFSVMGVKGRWISAVNEHEEAGYHCIVKLLVDEAVPARYILSCDAENLDDAYFYFTGSSEELLKFYAREIYSKEMLSAQGDYAISDYKLISCSWHAETADKMYVVGLMKYAFSPEQPELAHWWAGNTSEGQGNYKGMLVRTAMFTLRQSGDGIWECIDMGTGGVSPEFTTHRLELDELWTQRAENALKLMQGADAMAFHFTQTTSTSQNKQSHPLTREKYWYTNSDDLGQYESWLLYTDGRLSYRQIDRNYQSMGDNGTWRNSKNIYELENPGSSVDLSELMFYGLEFNGSHVTVSYCSTDDNMEFDTIRFQFDSMGNFCDYITEYVKYSTSENGELHSEYKYTSSTSVYSFISFDREEIELVIKNRGETPREQTYVSGSYEDILADYVENALQRNVLAYPMGGLIRMTDYRPIEYGVDVLSLDGKSFIARTVYAMKPEDPALAREKIAGNAYMGRNEYQGWIITTQYLTFTRLIDGAWAMVESNTGGVEWGYYQYGLTDAEIVEKLRSTIMEKDEIGYLRLLPLAKVSLVAGSDFIMDFMDMLTESAVSDYNHNDNQLIRDLYIMKGSLVSDGALTEHYANTLFALYQHDEMLFNEALELLPDNERNNVQFLLDYAMSYYE